eukprot:5410224-Pyramimonas_sp.AAC.1
MQRTAVRTHLPHCSARPRSSRRATGAQAVRGQEASGQSSREAHKGLPEDFPAPKNRCAMWGL